MNYFLDVLKNKYAQFNGRARRAEYWQFVLFYIIGFIAIQIVGGIFAFIHLGFISALLSIAYIFGMIIPLIALRVRRMHDVGKEWWFILIPIYSFILEVTEGTKGSNEYGPDPKGYTTTDTFGTPPSTY